MTTPAPVFELSIHRGYACARSGACCTSGWDIPVEHETARVVDGALRSGRLSLARTVLAGDAAPVVVRRPPDLPSEYAGVLATAPPARPADTARHVLRPRREVHAGAPGVIPVQCVLYERDHGGLCALQRQCGHAALPLACRQFPRMSLRDRRGTFVSLSHYCPTAARLLWRDDVALALHEAPTGPVDHDGLEGLDARDVLPPLLRPGVLWTLDAVTAWEHAVIGLCAREDLGVESVMGALVEAAEALRAWRPLDGPFDAFAERALRNVVHIRQAATPAGARPGDAAGWLALARTCVPAPAARHFPGLTDRASWTGDHDRLWQAHARVVRRYLAARAFGSWLLYQGGGIRSLVRGMLLAVGVLRAALMAQDPVASPGDGRGMLESVRIADLILVHLVEPAVLGAELAALESSNL